MSAGKEGRSQLTKFRRKFMRWNFVENSCMPSRQYQKYYTIPDMLIHLGVDCSLRISYCLPWIRFCYSRYLRISEWMTIWQMDDTCMLVRWNFHFLSRRGNYLNAVRSCRSSWCSYAGRVS